MIQVGIRGSDPQAFLGARINRKWSAGETGPPSLLRLELEGVSQDHLYTIVEGDEEHGKPVGTPVSEERVNSVFDSDVATYISESKKVFPNLESLPEEAQQVIVNMCFNMGAPRFGQFKKFIAGVNSGDWNTAAVEMMDSRWAKQVGVRAERLRDRIKALA